MVSLSVLLCPLTSYKVKCARTSTSTYLIYYFEMLFTLHVHCFQVYRLNHRHVFYTQHNDCTFILFSQSCNKQCAASVEYWSCPNGNTVKKFQAEVFLLGLSKYFLIWMTTAFFWNVLLSSKAQIAALVPCLGLEGGEGGGEEIRSWHSWTYHFWSYR